MIHDFIKGDLVSITQYLGRPREGLTYPSFKGILLEDPGEGWQVVEVENDQGEQISIYSFSIQSEK